MNRVGIYTCSYIKSINEGQCTWLPGTTLGRGPIGRGRKVARAGFCSNVRPKQRRRVSLSGTLFAGSVAVSSLHLPPLPLGFPSSCFSSSCLIIFSVAVASLFYWYLFTLVSIFVSQVFSALVDTLIVQIDLTLRFIIIAYCQPL